MNDRTILSFVGQFLPFDPGNRVFDALLLIGPIVIFAIIVSGRNRFTYGLAVTYHILFVAAIIHAWRR